ncbi:hypothetical protein [Aestuariimicrobium ganziense]|nr:hypothetical protein [Aestuariimicrobium ganziense]
MLGSEARLTPHARTGRQIGDPLPAPVKLWRDDLVAVARRNEGCTVIQLS